MLNSNNHDGGAMLLSGTWAAVVGANHAGILRSRQTDWQKLHRPQSGPQTGEPPPPERQVHLVANTTFTNTVHGLHNRLSCCPAFSGLSIESDPS